LAFKESMTFFITIETVFSNFSKRVDSSTAQTGSIVNKKRKISKLGKKKDAPEVPIFLKKTIT
jgi:hypothetical protein